LRSRDDELKDVKFLGLHQSRLLAMMEERIASQKPLATAESSTFRNIDKMIDLCVKL
jgi:hypothetical protein